jgi:hypothetical protein
LATLLARDLFKRDSDIDGAMGAQTLAEGKGTSRAIKSQVDMLTASDLHSDGGGGGSVHGIGYERIISQPWGSGKNINSPFCAPCLPPG